MLLPIRPLQVEDQPGFLFYGFDIRDFKGGLVRLVGRSVVKPDISPSLGIMHVYNALGRPYPIAFGQGRAVRPLFAPVLSIGQLMLPLHAGKVNAPGVLGRPDRTLPEM